MLYSSFEFSEFITSTYSSSKCSNFSRPVGSDEFRIWGAYITSIGGHIRGIYFFGSIFHRSQHNVKKKKKMKKYIFF